MLILKGLEVVNGLDSLPELHFERRIRLDKVSVNLALVVGLLLALHTSQREYATAILLSFRQSGQQRVKVLLIKVLLYEIHVALWCFRGQDKKVIFVLT